MRALLAALVIVVLGALSGGPAAAASPDISLTKVLTGFNRPVQVAAHTGLNRLYVVEQRGTIQVLRRDSPSAPWQKAGIFLDLRAKILGPIVNRGLLAMAFHPNYANNGRFYVFYTRQPDGHIVIAEYRRSTNLYARRGSERILIVVRHTTEYHLGGWLGFGPDGNLYVTIGDAADQPIRSQDPHVRHGKILRLNALAARGSQAQVPSDNPFADGVEGHPLVWAIGVRNPWRVSFDSVTGDLWAPDVGADAYEEVNVFRDASAGNGANLGWQVCEGTHSYPISDPVQPCTLAGSTLPVLEYPHANGDCSVIGGYVYRGTAQPSLVGRYFFGDYCSGRIWSVPSDYNGGPLDAPLDSTATIMSFGVDGAGELYVTGQGGNLFVIRQT